MSYEQTLVTPEEAILSQADSGKALGSTFNERKQMSTKTTLKRIALVAVSALGFGLMSVVPSYADESTTAEVGGLTATTNGMRAGITTAMYLKALPNSSSVSGDTVRIESVVSQRPTGSAVALNDTSTITVSSATVAFSGAGTAAVSSTTEHTFTPDVAGVYTVIAWHDQDNNGVRNAGEKSLTVTLDVVAQTDPVTATVSLLNSSAGANTTYGSAATVTIKNSKGAVTRLGSFEQLAVAASSSGSVFAGTDSNGVQTPYAGSGSAVTALTQANFTKGIAYLNITKAAAGTSVLSVNGETGAATSGVATSNTITFRSIADCLVTADNGTSDDLTFDNTTGVKLASAGDLDVAKSTATTVSFISTLDDDDAEYVADSYCQVRVTDNSGFLTGAASLIQDRVTLADDADLAFTVAVNLPLSAYITVQLVNQSGDSFTISGETAVATTMANVSDNFRTLNGGSTTVTAKLTDQFGIAMASQSVTITVTGRNSKTASALTDANGYVSYTLADTVGATSALSSDSVEIDGPGSGDSDTATITYGASLGVSTVTMTGGSTTAGVTATTATVKDIDAGVDGASTTTHSMAATVKDANGAVLVGVPVTFTISGTTGAAVLSTHQTVRTNTSGVATSYVYGWVAGTYTVTATADAKTGTASITFGQVSGAAEARVLSASVSGSIVTGKIVDRYGNPVSGVTVYATKTGAGYFGSGVTKTSGDTNASGEVEFIVAGGDAEVTLSTVNYTAVAGTKGSGQTCAAAGNVDCSDTAPTAFTAYAAGTATVAEDGVGASFAPAGVSSAKVSVTGVNAAAAAAEAAADAAAEAIDAANAATDAANLAAEAADAATVAAEEARDAADAATAAVEELATQVATLMAALKAQITTLANTVAKIAKKVRA